MTTIAPNPRIVRDIAQEAHDRARRATGASPMPASRFTTLDPTIDLAARLAHRRLVRAYGHLTPAEASRERTVLFVTRLAWLTRRAAR